MSAASEKISAAARSRLDSLYDPMIAKALRQAALQLYRECKRVNQEDQEGFLLAADVLIMWATELDADVENH